MMRRVRQSRFSVMAGLLGFLVIAFVGRASDGDAESGEEGPVPLRISHETTFFTEPLRKDGTVNYAAAVNRIYQKGVTPENNAAVPLLRIVGPERIRIIPLKDILRKLGVANTEHAGRRFTPLDKYVLAHAPKEKLKRPKLEDGPLADLLREANEDSTEMLKRLAKAARGETVAEKEAREASDQAQERPWNKEEFPMLAKWLEANAPALEKAVKATKRPKFFIPLIRPEPDWPYNSIPRPHLQPFRALADALVIRGMRLVALGDYSAANRDALAIYRLGRKIENGPSSVDRLISAALTATVATLDREIARQSDVPADLLKRMIRERRALAPLPALGRFIDHGYRLKLLSNLLTVYREQDGAAIAPGRPGEKRWSLNVPLRKINDICDRIRAAASKPLLFDRIHALRRTVAPIERKAEKTKDDVDSWLDKIAFLFKSSEEKNMFFCEGLAYSAMDGHVPSFGWAAVIDGRAMVSADLALTALALAAYERDHGAYPVVLEWLAPDYLPNVPIDRFTGQPLRYRRTKEGYVLYSFGSDGEDDWGEQGYEHGDQVIRVSKAEPSDRKSELR